MRKFPGKWTPVWERSNKQPQLWNVELYDHHNDTFKVVTFALTEDVAWRRMRAGKNPNLLMVGWAGSGHRTY